MAMTAHAGEKTPVTLAGRHILLGVTGSIAAYKTADWVRRLTAQSARATIVMTGSAEQFVSRLTFSSLSGNPVYSQMFPAHPDGSMAHIDLGREADLFLIAPATAHTIARLAHGLADDLLTTLALSARIPVLLCPAMNPAMYDHPATRNNIILLQEYGYQVIEPGQGSTACGEEGTGRLVDWPEVEERLLARLCRQDLAGRTILCTAGPTREPIDPVRYLSNRSSGRMGYALARTAARRGADVVLVSGPVNLPDPPMVTTVRVSTALEMHEQVVSHAEKADIVIKAAAVADYRPLHPHTHKLKKDGSPLSLELKENPDILAELGHTRPNKNALIVGFAAESRNHEQEARRKLHRKKADLIIVNDILGSRTGFDVETNQVTLVDTHGSHPLPLLGKEETANRIWDHILTLM